jgi:hypothetical protein
MGAVRYECSSRDGYLLPSSWFMRLAKRFVTLPDHTMRKYDMEGTFINDFYVSEFRMLEYEKEEIVYRKNKTDDDGDGIVEELEEYYHPKTNARLRAYVASDGFDL